MPEQSHDVRELESAQEVPNALAALTKREMVTEVTQMLNEVSPASRVVLSLHYLHEMTLREVADVLDVSIGTVKSRLSYGLRSLRKKLGQTDSDGDLQR